MDDRRSFLKKTALLSTALITSNSLLSMAAEPYLNKKVREIGLQLYTIRDVLNQDVRSSIQKVAGIGYQHVETFYGYQKNDAAAKLWGLTVPELSSLLKDNQLKTYSGHYQLNDFLTIGNGDDSALKYQIDIAAALGQKYFIVPVPPVMLLDKLGKTEFQYMAAQLNKAGELCAKAGLTVGYHNHFWEFRQLADGGKGYDILLNETDPELVTFELDLFWIKKSGINPIDYFEKYPKRFSMWHVKDMDKNNTAVITGGALDKAPSKDVLTGISYAEVGTGYIDFKDIFKGEKKSGLKHIFVEQDVIKIDPFTSIKQSFDYVKQNLVK